jgi:hypothetical protein
MTATQAVPEKCPPTANIALPDISRDPESYSPVFRPDDQEILQYLNQGGTPGNVVLKIRQEWSRRGIFGNNDAIVDLTGDGVPEVLIIPSEAYIFGCQGGEYKNIFTPTEFMGTSFNGIDNQLVTIQDMNLNGIPEVLIADFGGGGMAAGQGLEVYVYEWDGTKFVTRIPKEEGFEVGARLGGGRLNEYLPTVTIKDVDHNGTKELILTGGITSDWYAEYYRYYPWRDQSDIYTWNGENFVHLKTYFSPPIYRYQAVQDGDREMLNQEYDNALKSYQEAIFSDKLLGWSQAHKDQEMLIPSLELQTTPTPPAPPDDPKEFPNLAAYARYRIMLLHLLLGNMNEATTVYETLQKKFPEGSNGHEFALVAKAFWDEYNLSQNVARSCAAAIELADKFKGSLHFLGSDYHNSEQDIMYTPQDVCPFK